MCSSDINNVESHLKDNKINVKYFMGDKLCNER